MRDRWGFHPAPAEVEHVSSDRAPLRILLVTGIYPPDIGGPATHAVDMVRELRSRGHEVQVLTLGEVGRVVREDAVVRLPRRWPWPVRLGAAVLWLLRRRSADVIYGVGMHEAAALAAWLTKIPLVVRIPGDHAWERARRLGLTRLTFEEFQQAGDGVVRVCAMRWLRNWCVRQSAAAVVPSRYLGGFVRHWAPGIRLEVVPIGVEVPGGLTTREPRDGVLRVIWAGRLVAHKRLDTLIEVVAGVGGVQLMVIGEGPARAALTQTVRARGLTGRVLLRGSLERREIWKELMGSDALLLASEYEGLPHVAIEALSVGVPVVAPDTPWAREVVVDGETGVLLPEATPQAFADLLNRLRADTEWRRRLTEAARAQAGRWSLKAAVDRIEAILSWAARRPRVVFVGKGGLNPPESLAAKLTILARYLDATVVSVRPRTLPPGLPVRTTAFPGGPRPVASALFYGLAPLLAVFIASRRGGAVVCQSPYEGVGALCARRLLPARIRPRIVVEVHGDWRTATRLYGSRIRRLLAPIADQTASWALRHADRVRTVSAEMEMLIRQVGYRREVDRFVAYSDFAAFLASPPLDFPLRPVALFVGVLEAFKGADVLLDAFHVTASRVCDSELWLVGDGPWRHQLERQASSLGIAARVKFLGMRPRHEVQAIMDACRCLVLPSRSEGLGRVIIEAMARGRPVVASRVGGIPSLVEDGVTGFLVPSEDAAALAGALENVLGDRGAARRMGQEARRRIEARDPAREFEEGIKRLAAWCGAAG